MFSHVLASGSYRTRIFRFHSSDKLFGSRSPAGDSPKGLRERNIQRVHTVWSENVDGSGQRCRDGRDEDCEAPVRKVFDDECRNEGLLNLGERRLPCVVLALSRQPLGKASKQRVTRNSVEQGFLDLFPNRPASWS